MDRSGRQGLGLAGWAVPEWEVAGRWCRNGGGGVKWQDGGAGMDGAGMGTGEGNDAGRRHGI